MCSQTRVVLVEWPESGISLIFAWPNRARKDDEAIDIVTAEVKATFPTMSEPRVALRGLMHAD